jgi:hypothetical protein
MFNDLFSRNGLSLDRLRNFLEVAEVGSIAKAAPNDVSRQSLISRQIRELEEFFGVELTVRRGKTLAISPAGERLSVLIREQFRDLLDFQREQRGEGKTFSFGAGASLLEWFGATGRESIARGVGVCKFAVYLLAQFASGGGGERWAIGLWCRASGCGSGGFALSGHRDAYVPSLPARAIHRRNVTEKAR